MKSRASDLTAVLGGYRPRADELSPVASEVPTAIARRLSGVKARPVRWLWPSYVAHEKLTLIVGKPGVGKSFVSLDMAACVSSGRAFPDGTLPTRGTVLILSAEDSPDDTIRPRLDALGGDPSRVVVLEGVKDGTERRWFSLTEHLQTLEDEIRKHAAVLVVIDPISAYLGDADSHSNSEVRAMLAQLADVAARTGAAVVVVTHPSKAVGQSAVYAANGSVAFGAAPRVVLLAGKHPHDESGARRVLIGVKCNIGAEAPARAYRLAPIPDDPDRATLEWESGTIAGLTAELVNQGHEGSVEEREERHDAEGFLRDQLADGPKPAKELQRDADDAGISRATLRRAASRLGIKPRKTGAPGSEKQCWHWSLPAPDFPGDDAKMLTAPAKMLTQNGVSTFGSENAGTLATPHTSAKMLTFEPVSTFGGANAGANGSANGHEDVDPW